MYPLYNFAIHIASFFLKIIAFFNPKIESFLEGRKDVFHLLAEKLSSDRPWIWLHAASLGEFEQGLPVIEALKINYPTHKILVTFFSPSGYEVKKNTPVADLVTYLPLDTKSNAKLFVAMVNPSIAIFVKYEIWPNYLEQLQKSKIPVLLISAIFKKEQVYFRWYGSFMRKVLRKISHFFVQNANSEHLLNSIGLSNCKVNGDTRFDRVSFIREQNNDLSFMNEFTCQEPCFVGGSTWPEDEAILVDFINTSENPVKYVLAPHTIKPDHIESLKKSITKKALLHSEIDGNKPADFQVLIVDTIGLLTKIYSYADIAYVGGAFATGLHNTLEPAVFGIPVLIGPDYASFKEAEDLVALKGIYVIHNKADFALYMNRFLQDDEFRKNTGQINSTYINKNKGASIQIIEHIRTLI